MANVTQLKTRTERFPEATAREEAKAAKKAPANPKRPPFTAKPIDPLLLAERRAGLMRSYTKFPNAAQKQMHENIADVLAARGGFGLLQHRSRKLRTFPAPTRFYERAHASAFYRLLLTGSEAHRGSDHVYATPAFHLECEQWALKEYDEQIVFEVLELMAEDAKTPKSKTV